MFLILTYLMCLTFTVLVQNISTEFCDLTFRCKLTRELSSSSSCHHILSIMIEISMIRGSFYIWNAEGEICQCTAVVLDRFACVYTVSQITSPLLFFKN